MIKVDVWSDINCPFCYIGKRHLEQALEKFPKRDQVVIEWKSFELDPDTHPEKGSDNLEMLAKKYGKDHTWAQAMNNNLTEMAAMAGIDFHLEKVIPANSFNAHRLLHLAKLYKMQDPLQEKLLAAKFIEGKDISDPAVLKSIALDIGLDTEEVLRFLDSNKFSQEVREDEAMAAKLGITGVPFFVFNESQALSGAHPVETFVDVLTKAHPLT